MIYLLAIYAVIQYAVAAAAVPANCNCGKTKWTTEEFKVRLSTLTGRLFSILKEEKIPIEISTGLRVEFFASV